MSISITQEDYMKQEYNKLMQKVAQLSREELIEAIERVIQLARTCSEEARRASELAREANTRAREASVYAEVLKKRILELDHGCYGERPRQCSNLPNNDWYEPSSAMDNIPYYFDFAQWGR